MELLAQRPIFKALLVVISIGVGNAEMRGWASPDNRNNPMYFHLTNFNQFAQLAHYIHKGKFTITNRNYECNDNQIY